VEGAPSSPPHQLVSLGSAVILIYARPVRSQLLRHCTSPETRTLYTIRLYRINVYRILPKSTPPAGQYSRSPVGVVLDQWRSYTTQPPGKWNTAYCVALLICCRKVVCGRPRPVYSSPCRWPRRNGSPATAVPACPRSQHAVHLAWPCHIFRRQLHQRRVVFCYISQQVTSDLLQALRTLSSLR